jgi:SAM-dependent methyltransferase
MTVQSFYDNLAPYYKFIYVDWEVSVRRQAAALDTVFREFFGRGVRRILDVACGIGTQSIGLAQLGYVVTASDISAAEITLARKEAARRNLAIEFQVADMRELQHVRQLEFDAVIACDNAIPHLPSDADILLAFQRFHICLRTGGGCLISVRDYAAMDRTGTQLIPRGVRTTPTGRVVIFDVWDFDGDFYDMSMYVVEETGLTEARTQILRARYYCVAIDVLERLMNEAGFVKVRTLRDRFFQPLILGTKA